MAWLDKALEPGAAAARGRTGMGTGTASGKDFRVHEYCRTRTDVQLRAALLSLLVVCKMDKIHVATHLL